MKPKVIQVSQWKGELTMVLYDNGQVFFESGSLLCPWIEMKLPHECGFKVAVTTDEPPTPEDS